VPSVDLSVIGWARGHRRKGKEMSNVVAVVVVVAAVVVDYLKVETWDDECGQLVRSNVGDSEVGQAADHKTGSWARLNRLPRDVKHSRVCASQSYDEDGDSCDHSDVFWRQSCHGVQAGEAA